MLAAWLLAGCLCLPGVAGAATAEMILERFFQNLRTLQADFEQETLNASLAAQSSAQGRLYVSRPGKFRWDYLRPYRQQVISDGRQLWIYDEDLEQVTRRPLMASLGHTPALLLSEQAPLKESFFIHDEGETLGVRWIRLLPRSEQANFVQIKLAFRRGQLREMHLRDKLDQLTRLRFTRLEKNPALDDDLFSFTPPEGVDVFEAGE